MKKWPEVVPELIWKYDGIGEAPSSPVVVNNRVFVTGIPGTLPAIGRLYAFDTDGRLLRDKNYGTEFTALFPGTRIWAGGCA